jgi:hypothetical protein
MCTPRFSFLCENSTCFHIPDIFLVNTLYSTLLAFTHRQKDRRRLKYTCCAWAGGTFFPVVLCVVSVFGSGGKVLRVQYSCGVVLVFWFRREIVFGVTYILSVQCSCAVVSVFWLQREIVLKMRTRFYKKSYWVTLL